MPTTEIRLYREDDGSTPVIDWLAKIKMYNPKAYQKCRKYLDRLARFGNELRRPSADYLRDGIYELRVRHSGINYRILYGFVGRNVVLVSHGLTKEKLVPPTEIELALRRLAKYRKNPLQHTSTEEI
jgi:phage-related protein